MLTCSFAHWKELPEGSLPISICQRAPSWWTGRVEPRLSPGWRALKASREDFDAMLRLQLAALDAREVWGQIQGDRAVLLCWEGRNVWCHRRMVAEWFESQLQVVVSEFGLDRSEITPYREMHARLTTSPRKAPPGKANQPTASELVLPETFDSDFFGGMS